MKRIHLSKTLNIFIKNYEVEMAPHIRPFLAVSQTTLTNPETSSRYPFLGLYTTKDLKKGEFLGFYNGDFKDGDYKGKSRYAFSTSIGYFKPKEKKGIVDPLRYPLAMCNEPPPHQEANVFLKEFSSARHTIPSLPQNTQITAIGFYACKNVRAGSELFINYGPDYHGRRDYPNPNNISLKNLVGKGCKLKASELQRPNDMFQQFGMHPFVDKECYRELE